MLGLRYYAAFSLVVASRGYSWLQFTDFSLWWLLLLWSTASRCPGFSSCSTWAQECIFWALEHRFSSCGAWAQPLRWHVGSSQTPCLLHWQADSLLLNHQGSPVMSWFWKEFLEYPDLHECFWPALLQFPNACVFWNNGKTLLCPLPGTPYLLTMKRTLLLLDINRRVDPLD